ncbi:hypothetical protein B0H14DRAFT_3136279 [Mycena olivaceomarginata]|nr:hypothetical protein B0H14DRAFT_3136279 [Mycena olivaceomarginata]
MITGGAAIHSRGVIHGDFHPGNFGFAAPELNNMILVSISRTRNPKSFPAYLSGRVDLGKPPLRYVPESVQRPLSHSPLMNRIPLKRALPSPTLPRKSSSHEKRSTLEMWHAISAATSGLSLFVSMPLSPPPTSSQARACTVASTSSTR